MARCSRELAFCDHTSTGLSSQGAVLCRSNGMIPTPSYDLESTYRTYLNTISSYTRLYYKRHAYGGGRILVCDNGTGFMKYGYAGANFPVKTFPSLAGRSIIRAHGRLMASR